MASNKPDYILCPAVCSICMGEQACPFNFLLLNTMSLCFLLFFIIWSQMIYVWDNKNYKCPSDKSHFYLVNRKPE